LSIKLSAGAGRAKPAGGLEGTNECHGVALGGKVARDSRYSEAAVPGGFAPAWTGLPHLQQNAASSGSSWPHAMQCTRTSISSAGGLTSAIIA
jgi:hypothetical protein